MTKYVINETVEVFTHHEGMKEARIIGAIESLFKDTNQRYVVEYVDGGLEEIEGNRINSIYAKQ